MKVLTGKQRLYLEWLGYNEYEIEEVETEIKNGEKPLVFDSNQYYAWESGYNMGLKAKVNITTISDAPLEKQPMTEKQKKCVDWIEEMTGAVYEGGSVSDFINEHIEEARFQSELIADANDPNG